ncbi:hypothetical protein AMTR_s00012p00235010 [Amborella trichopoda]|uniref:Uncharacterized protein n=1 Tax=Amborella trichopoda TaxID=13333 RepID=W1PL93_AMBTC|nr:hypothetical protein AMTR_s00012p00235010 [Amborella trichopoda]
MALLVSSNPVSIPDNLSLYFPYDLNFVDPPLSMSMYFAYDLDFAYPFTYKNTEFQPEENSGISSSNGIVCYHEYYTNDFVLRNPLLR